MGRMPLADNQSSIAMPCETEARVKASTKTFAQGGQVDSTCIEVFASPCVSKAQQGQTLESIVASPIEGSIGTIYFRASIAPHTLLEIVEDTF